MPISEVYLAHELDAAWIIALWKAIHGGDPSPEAVAAEAIAALAQYLRGAEYSFSFTQLEKRFASLGIQVTESSEAAGAQAGTAKAKGAAVRSIDEPEPNRSHQYCFKVGGQTICAQLPALAHRLSAA